MVCGSLGRLEAAFPRSSVSDRREEVSLVVAEAPLKNTIHDKTISRTRKGITFTVHVN